MTTDEDVRRYAMGQWCSCILEHQRDCPIKKKKKHGQSLAATGGDSYRVRAKVFERDGGRCRYCGKTGWTLDHVVPRQMGGETTVENCVVACERCNVRKGHKLDWKPTIRPTALSAKIPSTPKV